MCWFPPQYQQGASLSRSSPSQNEAELLHAVFFSSSVTSSVSLFICLRRSTDTSSMSEQSWLLCDLMKHIIQIANLHSRQNTLISSPLWMSQVAGSFKAISSLILQLFSEFHLNVTGRLLHPGVTPWALMTVVLLTLDTVHCSTFRSFTSTFLITAACITENAACFFSCWKLSSMKQLLHEEVLLHPW